MKSQKIQVFDELYARLNKQQKKAVDTIDGPVMVIAGPGTGKTTILTLRIANILRKTDTPASGILAITFTDAGVKAMRMKLRAVIGSRADEVKLYTFHGFAASIIAEFPDHFTRIYRSQQMTEIEAQELVRGILKDKKYKQIRPLGEPDFYISAILKTISDAKRDALTPGKVRDFARTEAKRLADDPDSLSTRGATKGQLRADIRKQIEKLEKTVLFGDIYETYEEEKRADKKIDFDDLIFELLQAIRTDELLKSLIQEKYLYLLVDEHQDTNDSQNAIIRLIASFFDEPNLFVVGDEKQAIYRFQGASVENFLQFQSLWKNMQTISLEDNYRSHQHILDAGFSLIQHNYAEGEHASLRTKLKAVADEKPRPIEVISAGSTASADRALVDRLKNFVERCEKNSGSTAAVIVRRNRDVEKIATLCEAHGIYAASERGINIFLHPVGALFFELLQFLHNPAQIESLAVTLASGLWNIEMGKVSELVRLIKTGRESEVMKAIPAVSQILREVNHKGGLSFLVYVAEQSGFKNVVIKSPANAEVWRGIIALASELAGRDRSYADDPRKLIEALLAYKATAENRSVKVLSGTPDAPIRIMTAHGSKGLEYDEVFLPYAVNESWLTRPHSASFVLPNCEKAEGDELKDARRLFYVALTRARKHVTILVPLEDATGRMFTPLGFVDELSPADIARSQVPAEAIDTFVLAKTRGDEKRREELSSYAKTVLIEKGLSVTALNHFIKCPQEFLYKSILKVPEPPSAKSEGGSAMHSAMDLVWRTVRSDQAVSHIDTEIKTAVTEYLASSLLPSFEKEAIREELLEIAPVVAKALGSHFEEQGEVRTESWFETEFEGIRLHGKMDAVLVNGDTVKVFDYKTKQAMSPAAIKGETKSSNGDYFRQLVFYYMLLGAQSAYAGKQIMPALVFIKPDDKGRCPIISLPITQADVVNLKKEVAILVEAVKTGKLIDGRCGEDDCQWCGMSEL
ncbi:MAG: ATP-dependent DNA helicase [Patescibacteria group bacterium]